MAFIRYAAAGLQARLFMCNMTGLSAAHLTLADLRSWYDLKNNARP
jgi:hypothetical protein